MLLYFQRTSLIEEVDESQTSDNMSDFYESHDELKQEKIKNAVKSTLKELTQKGSLEQLDKRLLRGFYSSKRSELHLPRMLKDVKAEVDVITRSPPSPFSEK